MSYQVLARKWRPQTFTDVVGQQHVLTALANGLQQQRLHHAYLFSGTRGVGKTTIARLFAKGLNCEVGISQNPCGQCVNCLEIAQGRFVDLIEIDAASRTKVEDTRELLDNVQYAPTRGRFKVYLIDEVHMLSRHSFNALLKTLEEPPEHVKFLLATTDPQKLPITVLSRCLQFHLRTLDIDQISRQLERILVAEQISSDKRARQLIARAAEGSLRDALSLTDQAIAMGQGQVSADSVSQMLGILDDEQPLAIIEAIVHADGQKMMALVEDIALRGSDWENVLIEMLSLVHRIAMIQLLPVEMQDTASPLEERLRLLARSITPTDLQLYYQILFVGRKELPYAPEKRMGVEMTLLRALAFHPKCVNDTEISLVSSPNRMESVTAGNDIDISSNIKDKKKVIDQAISSSAEKLINTPTLQLLKAKASLKQEQEKTPLKKSDTALSKTKTPSAMSALERLATVSAQHQRSVANQPKQIKKDEKNQKDKSYQWRPQNISEQKIERVTTPGNIKQALEYERTPELANKIALEARERDHWSAEISQLKIPKLIEQLALNAYKESLNETEICLHLRSTQRHLNTEPAHKALTKALCELYGQPIKLVIIEDDNPAVKTPLEWRQLIYEEKLAQARQSIIVDKTIQTLRTLFDAQLDEESIRPV
ncbi:MAG TPA: DNA polymerase III subunit gamma/tau [Arsenophonus apicola]|uniref:DNA polymerase III subunit gamma/tau n=1 Tax=Arsenophonus TaxID=637 RepID=UPI0015D68697|nr:MULTISPECIES: DNA polymerase III subunit gamma/tau [Arsenophonus]UBX28615.1 DNA polymerase III subunit gamma/tau [Arsenophonus apicola]